MSLNLAPITTNEPVVNTMEVEKVHPLKRNKVNAYNGRELMTAPLNVSVLDVPSNSQWGKLKIEVNNETIKLKFKGLALNPEFALSSFGKDKLQIGIDHGPDAYLEAFAASFQRSIQQYIDDHTLPEIQASVRSLVRGRLVYATWPKGKPPHVYGTIEGPAGQRIAMGTEEYQRLCKEYLVKECEYTVEVVPWVMTKPDSPRQLDIGFSLYLLGIKKSA